MDSAKDSRPFILVWEKLFNKKSNANIPTTPHNEKNNIVIFNHETNTFKLGSGFLQSRRDYFIFIPNALCFVRSLPGLTDPMYY
jgi:hypothetical protein